MMNKYYGLSDGSVMYRVAMRKSDPCLLLCVSEVLIDVASPSPKIEVLLLHQGRWAIRMD